MERRRTAFATRLFLALFLLSALPSAALLGFATWGLRNYVELAGDADAWRRVGNSGRELLDAVRESTADSATLAAAGAHEAELSRSLTFSRRFELLATRLAGMLPWAALALGLTLAGIALWAGRGLARQLSRPLNEVVDWANRLAREEPLPEPSPGGEGGAGGVGSEGGEGGAREFGALRTAFRHMAERLEEGRRQAVEAERLRAWTRMARGVAHEIKNPLTPLSFAIRGAREASARGDTTLLEENLAIIAEEASRLDEIARSFAQLGRLPEGPPSEIDLEELLGSLLASDLPRSVTADLKSEGVPLITGHLTTLTRVFRNLIGNAVEALSDQGEGRIEVSLAAVGDRVEVAIADDGPGIPAEHRDRIWEADFTTRSRGTGIGLALVRSAVRAHGGEVEVRARDEGALFVVTLPIGKKVADEEDD